MRLFARSMALTPLQQTAVLEPQYLAGGESTRVVDPTPVLYKLKYSVSLQVGPQTQGGTPDYKQTASVKRTCTNR